MEEVGTHHQTVLRANPLPNHRVKLLPFPEAACPLISLQFLLVDHFWLLGLCFQELRTWDTRLLGVCLFDSLRVGLRL
jgi:hypothetical protein